MTLPPPPHPRHFTDSNEAPTDPGWAAALETVPFPTLARPGLPELTRQVGKALLQLLLDVSGTERDDVLVHDFIWRKRQALSLR